MEQVCGQAAEKHSRLVYDHIIAPRDVSPVNECDPSLVVTLHIFEVGGRQWLPSTETKSFTVTPDDRVMYPKDD